MLATTAAMLAQALYAQDRMAEAESSAPSPRRRGRRRHRHPGDLARREGQTARSRRPLDEAEALARGAVEMVEPTDLLTHRGDALLDLAEVLSARSPESEYQRVLRLALSRYEAKANAVGAARVRSLLGPPSGGRNAVQRQFREDHAP